MRTETELRISAQTTQTRRFFRSYNNIKYYFLLNFTNQAVKRAIATFFFIFYSLILVIVTTSISSLQLYCNPFLQPQSLII